MKKIISILILLIIGLSSTFAASSLNVVLANQNPDPVAPGNFVYVNVKVSNTGSIAVENAKIKFIENQYFKIAPGENKEKELGTIPSFSSLESSSSYSIAKYKILVDSNAPLGLNTLNFQVESVVNKLNYEFDILVQDANPTIELLSSKLENDFIKAGESQKIKLTFTNQNSIDLKDVIVSLDLEEVEDKVLTTKSGSNQIFIGKLKAKEQKEIEIELVATPNADSKPYLLPIKIEYEDSLGNSYEKDLVSSVQIYSKPELTLEIDSQEIYTTGKGKVTISIANPSPTTSKGVELRILPNNNYQVLDGDFHYVGDLNPDDFQTLQSEMYISSIDSKLNVEIKYLDSYNREIVETRELDLKLFEEEKLAELGLTSSKSSGSSLGTIILVIVVSFITFFIGRKLGYLKAKRKLK